jgi:tetraacyldisaccharide 4'-kinase
LPAAGFWRAASAVRDGAYARGWLRQDTLPLPSIGVGNLTIGASGRGPVMVWIARHLHAQGRQPGLLLRGNSPWRVAAFEHAAPGVAVRGLRDAMQGAVQLANTGARAIVMECRIPAQDIRPDRVIAVVGAETSAAVRWSLPAGPWRERWSRLGDVDAVVVARKRAPLDAALALAAQLGEHTSAPIAVAHLGVRHLEGLVSRTEHPASLLRGRRVVAASGSADPGAFVSQIKATGAAVQVAQWEADDDMRDHDVAWLAHAARRADHVVVSEADAVKLRDRWPARVAEPLVAVLDLTWERDGDAVISALDLPDSTS